MKIKRRKEEKKKRRMDLGFIVSQINTCLDWDLELIAEKEGLEWELNILRNGDNWLSLLNINEAKDDADVVLIYIKYLILNGYYDSAMKLIDMYDEMFFVPINPEFTKKGDIREISLDDPIFRKIVVLFENKKYKEILEECVPYTHILLCPCTIINLYHH